MGQKERVTAASESTYESLSVEKEKQQSVDPEWVDRCRFL